MKKATAHKILDIQEAMREDTEYKQLFAEYIYQNDRFLECLATMTQEQTDTVMDYIGILNELHLKTLDYAVQ